jgi:hypothetical protein
MHIRTLLVITLLTAGAGAAQAQQPQAKVAENKAERSRGAGADPNVKADRAPNHEGATAAPAPAAKGGERTRGGVSVVHVDNWTQWYIDVYMDGTFCGSMGPWGDTYCYVGSGNTTMYARALFDDGTILKWGPRVDYVDGAYTWKLNP